MSSITFISNLIFSDYKTLFFKTLGIIPTIPNKASYTKTCTF